METDILQFYILILTIKLGLTDFIILNVFIDIIVYSVMNAKHIEGGLTLGDDH